ncbi:uncharacterized protein LOC122263102 [Penaeus japonicus]|uniref:uncharacterized protein LOC122263102 n=1 Tax=Penaeus japonicus TaxID=27405 RepID=UPI001C70F6A9|nr:uncharacterized protein LOC122263102 [Penaeus japonicus]
MPENINNNVSGLGMKEHNFQKFYFSVMRVGRSVCLEVFTWGYRGGSEPTKDAIMKLPGYNNTRFRKDFNSLQQKKLSNGEPVAEFDITLIYKLLQMVCGLKEASSPDWVTAESDSLEYYLYAIKTKRNDVAHEKLKLSPEDTVVKLEELKALFTKTLQKAGERYGVDDSEVLAKTSAMERELNAIRDSPVPPATVAEYEKEKKDYERECILKECSEEVARLAECVSLVDIAGHKVNVSKVFTYPKLKRDETHILQRRLTVAESYVEIPDLLIARECDESRPQVVLLSGLIGMGKSAILKFIVDQSFSDRNAICNLDSFDVVLYLECLNVRFSSLSELFAILLPRTSSKHQPQEFQQHLFSLRILLLLDDFDSLDTISFGILEEFFRMMSPETRIVATASREKSKEIQKRIVAQHKMVLFLEVEGIPDDQTVQHVWKIMQNGIPNGNIDQECDNKLYSLITAKRPCLQDHLRSPEVLNALAICWAFSPERINNYTTVTEIFILIQELISQKVLQNIIRPLPLPDMITKAIVRSKLSHFLETLSRVAAKSLVKGYSVIEQGDLLTLEKKCRNLKLEKEPLISAFLNYTHEQGPNILNCPRNVFFAQRSTMQYYAANFLCRRCARRQTAIRDLLRLQAKDFGGAIGSNLQAMVKYLLGLLAVHMPERLKLRAVEIVSLLKDAGVEKTSQWLQYIDEAKEEPTITGEILKQMGDEWKVEDFAISSTLVNILKMRPPRRLTVTVCETATTFPHLREVLKICSETPQLTLSLHLYQHFWSEKIETSDQYLDIVVGKSCYLEHFAGRLSAEALLRLPASLQRLALHVAPELIQPLNQTIAKMPDLGLLYLNLDASPETPPSLILPLSIPNENTHLSVDIWKVKESSIEWSCQVARALSTTYKRLVLRSSELDLQGCQKWLEGLHQQGVKGSEIVVGSTHAMADEGIEQLRQIARHIECSKFVWLKV